MQEYEKLLDDVYSQLPESAKSSNRFEIPKVTGHLQGNKTIINNFTQICTTLRRNPTEILKYLLRELAAPGYVEGPRLILGRKISSALINTKIERYCNEFVLCSECKKPDTILKKEERVTMLKCTACGAKHPIKTKI